MKKWIIYPKKSDDIIEQLLINRKIEDKESFLNPDYNDLHDPYLFRDMPKAVSRINQAIKNKEKIGIFGDYDADGIPGAAVLYKFFNYLGAETEVYIPSRDEGYGLNEKGIRELFEKNCKLIISVDLGIVDKEKVEFGKNLGVDFIITDHHEIQKKFYPDNAFAVIHPNLEGQNYPEKCLAGGGVGWKLAQALAIKQQNKNADNYLKWLLDLAAVSTISDIVPLIGENRVIAKYGLIVLNKTKNLGFEKMFEVANITKGKIGVYAVGFQIGPRINAPGRLNAARSSFDLLVSKNENIAMKLAQELNYINIARQEELERILKEAKEKIKKSKLERKKVILIEGENWPKGIIGLVAGKLMDEFARPVLVLSREGKSLKGSGRSISEYHLVEALDQCKKYLTKYGGHARAAGVSLELKHLSNLYDQLLEIAESKLKFEELIPKISIDARINFPDINFKLINKLKKFEPHGLGNPRPVFLLENAILKDKRLVGQKDKHLKVKVMHDNVELDGIGFDLGFLYDKLNIGVKLEIVFTLEENEWNGTKKVQLKILDLKYE